MKYLKYIIMFFWTIRWVLISSLSKKKSIAYNLLKSEDVMSAIECIKTLGSKVKFVKNRCEIIGNGFHIKKKGKILINAGNSGTLGRIILGLLIGFFGHEYLTSPYTWMIIGLSERFNYD